MSTQIDTATYMLKLENRFPVAEGTMAFQWEKPADFIFKPGQWIHLTLPELKEFDAKGNERWFSIASAPQEDFLLIATRLRDSTFKQALSHLPLGTEIKLEGPGGNFVLHHNSSRSAVFLAGGIGVTPVRSILLDATERKLPHRIFFFDSNRRPEDAPFLDELETLSGRNPNYTFIPTMTRPETSTRPWSGETGLIDRAMLERHLGEAHDPIYYVVGPPRMVNGLHAMLNEAGIDDDDIRAEDFGGY